MNGDGRFSGSSAADAVWHINGGWTCFPPRTGLAYCRRGGSRVSAQYTDPGASLIIGDMFHLRLRHPATLSLWVSDALVHLRWRHWDDSVATATGKITTHSGGRYRYLPAKVVASAPARCSGRFFGYTKLRYHAFGRWWSADREGCRFFGGGL